jgi:hypothetical protein
MNTLSSIEFDHTVSASAAMEAVESQGAVAIHDFLPEELRLAALNDLRDEPMYTDFTPENAKVERHQNLSQYGFVYGREWPESNPSMKTPPRNVHAVATYIADFVNSAENASWNPNEIMGHEYQRGQSIAGHRDYKRAVGFVAVGTLEGIQQFNVDLDSGETGHVFMRPGTLTLMRGYQGEAGKDRPYHSVEKATSRRLAISLRQMTDVKRPGWD